MNSYNCTSTCVTASVCCWWRHRQYTVCWWCNDVTAVMALHRCRCIVSHYDVAVHIRTERQRVNAQSLQFTTLT